ncbi:hypothetical protein KI387_033007, partial [Taxus chinensis]
FISTIYEAPYKNVQCEAPSQLRELVLNSCFNLKEFPRSIGRLKHLIKLSYGSLNSQSPLRRLPEEFRSLQSLRYLELKSCANLSSLPRRFGELTNLQHLNLFDCSNLSSLPSSISNLTNLQHLNLRFCLNLSSLPSRFGDLTNLQHLDMGHCIQLGTLPVSFKQLTLLQYLNFNRCIKLTIESENLDILENMTRLQYLDFSKCGNMEDLPRHCIENGASLKQLNLRWTRIREMPANIGQLSKLEILIVGSNALTSLPTTLGNLCSLLKLVLSDCLKVQKIEGLEYLRSLEELEICNCPELDGLPSFAELCSLKTLELRGCPKVEKIEGSEGLRSLEAFKAYTCLKVPCIISLEKARELRNVVVIANEKSVVEHFIPTIHQKRLVEVIICTRAVCDVGSFVNSQAFPNLSVLDSFSMEKIGSEQALELRGSSENATLICIIINVVSPVIHLVISSNYSSTFEMDLGQGKWVWMDLITQKPIWHWGNNVFGIFLKGSDENDVVESAWLMTAEDEEIRQCFRGLFHTFA